MQDEELIRGKFPTLIKLASEITEMQRQLKKQGKINGALEKELTRLKRIEEESRAIVVSFKERLADSNAQKELLREELEREVKERKRIVEEFRTVNAFLEERLARLDSEMELITKNLQDEIQAWKQALAFRSRFLLCTSRKKQVLSN